MCAAWSTHIGSLMDEWEGSGSGKYVCPAQCAKPNDSSLCALDPTTANMSRKIVAASRGWTDEDMQDRMDRMSVKSQPSTPCTGRAARPPAEEVRAPSAGLIRLPPQAEFRQASARANATVRAMHQGHQATVERATWDFLHTPAARRLAQELPLNAPWDVPDVIEHVLGDGPDGGLSPEEVAAVAVPQWTGRDASKSYFIGNAPPEASRPHMEAKRSADSSPEEYEAARASAQLWKSFNRARAQRVRSGIPITKLMDNIAGCLAYLRLPLEPHAQCEVSANLARHAAELNDLVIQWHMPKLRWCEQYQFARMPAAMQHDLMLREEGHIRHTWAKRELANGEAYAKLLRHHDQEFAPGDRQEWPDPTESVAQRRRSSLCAPPAVSDRDECD